jgi:hypothetical protein
MSSLNPQIKSVGCQPITARPAKEKILQVIAVLRRKCEDPPFAQLACARHDCQCHNLGASGRLAQWQLGPRDCHLRTNETKHESLPCCPSPRPRPESPRSSLGDLPEWRAAEILRLQEVAICGGAGRVGLRDQCVDQSNANRQNPSSVTQESIIQNLDPKEALRLSKVRNIGIAVRHSKPTLTKADSNRRI